jgi:hypothetical protein
MDWSDYYTENLLSTPDCEEAVAVFESIVNLWIEFANFEISLHQFKKAVQIYDDSLSDPIAKKSCKIYTSYAAFCCERKKLSNAQKVFIKGLCAGLTSSENNVLWSEYLKLMHKMNGSIDLTADQLYLAVKKQLTAVDSLLFAAPTPVQQQPEVVVANEAVNQNILKTETIAKEDLTVKIDEDNKSSVYDSMQEVIVDEKNTIVSSTEKFLNKNNIEVNKIEVLNNTITLTTTTTTEKQNISNINSNESSTLSAIQNFDEIAKNESKIDIIENKLLNVENLTNNKKTENNFINKSIFDFQSINYDNNLHNNQNTFQPPQQQQQNGQNHENFERHKQDSEHELEFVDDLAPEKIIKIFDKRPLMIFTAPNKVFFLDLLINYCFYIFIYLFLNIIIAFTMSIFFKVKFIVVFIYYYNSKL